MRLGNPRRERKIMLKLTVEYSVAGPLAHAGTLRKLEAAVDGAKTLEEAATAVWGILPLAAYRGGAHVAVHAREDDRLGDNRLAIITEEESCRS